MHVKQKKSLTFFLIAILILAALIFFYIEPIKDNIQNFVIAYGLIAVFVFAFLSDVLTQPIGPEVAAGFAIAIGSNPWLIFIFTVAGSIVGSLISYIIGTKFLSYKKILIDNKEYSGKIQRFKNHFRAGLFVAAITPVPWVIFCWLSGAIHMEIRDFFIFGLIPRTIRIAIVLGILGLVF